jgi:hypothetical protein
MTNLDLLESLGQVPPIDPDLLERTAQHLLAEARLELDQAELARVAPLVAEPVPPIGTVSLHARKRSRWARRLAVAAVAAALIGAGSVVLRPGSAGGPSTALAAEMSRLATVAANQPDPLVPGVGQYLYTDSQEAYTSTTVQPNGGSYTALVPETRQIWIGPDGSGRLYETYGTAVFLSPQDQANWVAAGSPSLSFSPTNQTFGPDGLSDGPTNLSSLPTNPAALAALINSRKVEGGPPGPAESFAQIGDLLRETDASPALRSALYEVAATLPGVQLLGSVTDHSGRAGVGIAYTSAGGQHELIFDPSTSALLGETYTVVGPDSAVSGSPLLAPVGTVTGWAVYQPSSVVDSTGDGAGATAGPSSPTSPGANGPSPAQ